MSTPSTARSTLEVGTKVQPFQATLQDGSKIDSTILLRENPYLLLIFYPGDDTPGCTKQLCGVRDVYAEYRELGVRVLGVNNGNEESHQKFIEKYEYPFDIIVDHDRALAEEFGAIGSFFGNAVTKRGVFLLNNQHEIVFQKWGQQDNQKIIDMLKQRD